MIEWNETVAYEFQRFAKARYAQLQDRCKAPRLMFEDIPSTFGFARGTRDNVVSVTFRLRGRVIERVVDLVWGILPSTTL